MAVIYQIRYLEEVTKKQIPSLSTTVKALIKNAIETKLMIDLKHLANRFDIALKAIDEYELATTA